MVYTPNRSSRWLTTGFRSLSHMAHLIVVEPSSLAKLQL